MNNFIKKNKILTVLTIYTLAMAAVVFLFFLPTVKQIEETANEVQKRIVEDEIIQTKISGIPEMKKNSEAFRSRENEINRAILNKGEEFEFIKKLETLAETTQNKIFMKIEDNPAKPAAKGKKDEAVLPLPYDNYLKIQIGLEGSLESFLNFLHQLENFENYANPTAFSLNKAKIEEKVEVPADVFAPSPEAAGTNTPTVPTTQTKEKEILKSNIELMVYIRK